MHRGFLALFLWLAWAGAARAQPAPGVLLLQRAGLRPELCAALRIQLSGLSDVRCEPESGAAALPERIVEASRRVRESRSQLAVFLERDPDPHLVRMYIVGSETDRAVLAMEQIEDRPEADIDRSLALKVAASVEVVSRVRAEQARQAVDQAQVPQEPTPLSATLLGPAQAQPESEARRGSRSWAIFLDLGGGVQTAPVPQGLASVDLGVSRVAARLRVDIGIGFELGTRFERSQALSQVRAWERGPFLSARVLRRHARFEWGGELVFSCPLMSAEGIARDGTRGEKTLALPSLGLGLDLRVRLFSSAFLRLSPRLEIPFVHQTLVVDDVDVLDFPVLGVTVPLSLIFYLPLSQGGT